MHEDPARRRRCDPLSVHAQKTPTDPKIVPERHNLHPRLNDVLIIAPPGNGPYWGRRRSRQIVRMVKWSGCKAAAKGAKAALSAAGASLMVRRALGRLSSAG